MTRVFIKINFTGKDDAEGLFKFSSGNTLADDHVMIKLTYSVCAVTVCHLPRFKGRMENIPASVSRHLTHLKSCVGLHEGQTENRGT